VGDWGAGIALQLRDQFPTAYNIQKSWCEEQRIDDLMGTCLLIPPQSEDYDQQHNTATEANKDQQPSKVYIACLFTSKGYGRGNKKAGRPGRSPKQTIIRATEQALADFVAQYQKLASGEDRPGDIFSVRFNAGFFGVPWETTEEALKRIWDEVDVAWTVVSR
jgi:ADP-ribose 1''-phosphate phosphatase